MTIDFCTYCDSGYLARCLALYRSLRRHAPSATLHVLALDEPARAQLQRLALPNLTVIPLADFEAGDEDLLAAKATRSVIEYYFTCTPSLCLYVLNTCPAASCLFYVDADMYFFSSPDPIIEEMRAASVYVVEHRFSERVKYLSEYGRFNVGILGFRNDHIGRACLESWRALCNSWCYDRLEDGKFADQKYLDDWPDKYKSLIIAQHVGVNLAPWNKDNYRLTQTDGVPHVDGVPVVCYHFHGFRIYSYGIVQPLQDDYGELSCDWMSLIYRQYFRALGEAETTLQCVSHADRRRSTTLTPAVLRTRARQTRFLVRLYKGYVRIPREMLMVYLHIRISIDRLLRLKARLMNRAGLSARPASVEHQSVEKSEAANG